MPVRRSSSNAGFSLIELMIAITAAIVVIGAGVSIISSTMYGNTNSVRMTRINQDLRGTMSMITHDLTRTGGWALSGLVTNASLNFDLSFDATSGTVTATAYRAGTTNTTDASGNGAFNFSSVKASGTALASTNALATQTLVLFFPGSLPAPLRLSITGNTATALTATVPSGSTLPSTTVTAGRWTILNPFATVTLGNAVSGSTNTYQCIIFSYDLNNDGALNDGSGAPSGETFGYRYDASSKTIQTGSYSKSGGTATPPTCAGAGTWSSVTDPKMLNITAPSGTSPFQIVNLSATNTASSTLQVTTSQYQVKLYGQSVNDTSITRQIQETVKPRNNWVR